jgi:hypothetical protein
MKRKLLLTAIVVLVGISAAVVKTTGQSSKSTRPSGIAERWEYLVLAKPSSTNFEPTGNSEMRKQDGHFGQEGFVLETQLDKVGRNGWELVSVAGAPGDPIYYFKRRTAQ